MHQHLFSFCQIIKYDLGELDLDVFYMKCKLNSVKKIPGGYLLFVSVIYDDDGDVHFYSA